MCIDIRRRRWWASASTTFVSLFIATFAHGLEPDIGLPPTNEWQLHHWRINLPRNSKSEDQLEALSVSTAEELTDLEDQSPGLPTSDLPPLLTGLSISFNGGDDPEFELELSQLEEFSGHSQVVLEYSLSGLANPAHRRLEGASHQASYRIQLLSERIKTMGRLHVLPQMGDIPGQACLARFVAKLKRLRRWKLKFNELHQIIGSLIPGEADEILTLTNVSEVRKARLIREEGKTSKFVDFVVRDTEEDWSARFYMDVPGTHNGLETMERDFVLLEHVATGETINSFRHRMRLDVPTDLYTIENLGNYVMGLEGRIFLNAVAKRPLLQVTVQDLLDCFLIKLRKFKKGLKALLSMSQQAVQAVSNLHSTFTVHTAITPDVFLVTEKGMVILGELQNIMVAEDTLKETLTMPAGYMPPELKGASGTVQKATFALDAWELGVTIFHFWCGCVEDEEELIMPQDETESVDFTCCTPYMPDAVRELIAAFTRINPSDRLLPEEAAQKHPAMLLSIYYDVDSDTEEEDGSGGGVF